MGNQNASKPLANGNQNPTPASAPAFASAFASAVNTNKQANLELSSPNGDGAVKKKLPWRDAAFEDFWSIVWEKTGRGAAYRRWEKVIKNPAMAEQVISEAKKQGPSLLKAARVQNRSALHPATWLNQERYLDEPAAEEKSDWEYAG